MKADDVEAQSRCLSYLFLANIASSASMWTFAPKMLAPLAIGAPMLEAAQVELRVEELAASTWHWALCSEQKLG